MEVRYWKRFVSGYNAARYEGEPDRVQVAEPASTRPYQIHEHLTGRKVSHNAYQHGDTSSNTAAQPDVAHCTRDIGQTA